MRAPPMCTWRRGPGRLETTAAIGWLASRAGGRPIALLAPPSWEGPIRMLGGRVEAGMIQTRLRPDSMEMPTRRRLIRSRALLLMSVALAFYFGFIALAIFRRH